MSASYRVHVAGQLKQQRDGLSRCDAHAHVLALQQRGQPGQMPAKAETTRQWDVITPRHGRAMSRTRANDHEATTVFTRLCWTENAHRVSNVVRVPDDPLTGATTTACFESCDTHKFNRTLVLRADGGMV